MPTILAIAASLAGIFLLAVQPLIRRLWRQWSLRRIPGPPSDSLVLGSFARVFSTGAMPYQDQLFETYGPTFRINGYLGAQVIITSDLDALQHIVVKHVEVFDSTDFFIDMVRMTFGPGLLGAPLAHGEHRRHRKLLNGAFSVSHLKKLVPLFSEVARQARKLMAHDIQSTARSETDVLDYMGRLALELIARGGFGHSFGVLEGKEDILGRALKRLGPANNKLFQFRPLLPILKRFLPPAFLRRIGELLPMPALHELIDVTDILERFSSGVWIDKKKAHTEGKVTNSVEEGHDVLSLLLAENDKTALQDKLPDNELQAQINTLLFAGTDTTSNALSRILTLLAEHPDAQEKLREELVKAGAPDVELGYEILDRLPYLEAVCRETLRLYTPIRFVQRQATQDHVLPLREPIVDVNGKLMTEIFVPKGTLVITGNAAVNRSKSIWGADAHDWEPERWLKPLPQTVQDAHIPGVYSNSLTFSGGTRACIGFKFSLLEMKSVLAQFIPSFEFRPSEVHKVSWWFGGITAPVVEAEKNFQAKLPLKVTCISV